jgi:hypothetical protein
MLPYPRYGCGSQHYACGQLASCLDELHRVGGSGQSLDQLLDDVQAKITAPMHEDVLEKVLKEVLQVLVGTNLSVDGREQVNILLSRLEDIFI